MKHKKTKYGKLLRWVDSREKEFKLKEAAKAAKIARVYANIILLPLVQLGLIDRKSRIYRKSKSWSLAEAMRINAERLETKYVHQKSVAGAGKSTVISPEELKTFKPIPEG